MFQESMKISRHATVFHLETDGSVVNGQYRIDPDFCDPNTGSEGLT